MTSYLYREMERTENIINADMQCYEVFETLPVVEHLIVR
jgi:hypothetical protein